MASVRGRLVPSVLNVGVGKGLLGSPGKRRFSVDPGRGGGFAAKAAWCLHLKGDGVEGGLISSRRFGPSRGAREVRVKRNKS